MRLGDLDALRDDVDTWGCNDYDKYDFLEAIDNAPTVPLPDFKEGYKQAILDGKTNYSRPQGEWIVTAEDNDGVHRICCPFCSYEKGSNNTDPIIVTFNDFPKFCENCGADMRGDTK